MALSNSGNMDYWYDQQIRRYLIQLIRVFSKFCVSENTENGVKYNRVPVRYAPSTRFVDALLNKNSENILQTVPQISMYITNIEPAPERRQDPFYQDIRQVAEREWDASSGSYTSNQGNLYSIDRYMPVPYNLSFNVDIWTSNTGTKLELLEQFMVLFNPSIQLQSNDNPLDWSNVFELTMTGTNWSTRTIPVGTDDQLDIATMNFETGIWISPPAKVRRQAIIQSIIADIHSVTSIEDLDFGSDYYDFFDAIEEDARVIVTPNDYRLRIESGLAILIDNTGAPQDWQDLLEMQGELTDASRIELNLSSDQKDRDILAIGSVVENPMSNTSLVFNLDTDTLPGNTLTDVDRVIDPTVSSPGVDLPAAATGQRYLLTEAISTDYPAWVVDAEADDIIEYNGTAWTVVFDRSTATDQEWVTSVSSGSQFTWTGTQWISSWQGVYNPGFWRLIL